MEKESEFQIMKKQRFAATIPFCLAALALPISSCGNNGGSSSPAPASSSSSSSSSSSETGGTLIKLEADDRGVGVGATLALHASVYGPSAKIHYVSTDPSIATIDDTGVVTGVKPGFVTLHAVSDYDSSVFGSFTLFVEPNYIVSLVKDYRGYDYADGLSFPGKIGIMMNPVSSGSTEEESTLYGPFTFALQNKAYPLSDGSGVYHVPSFDLRISPESTISSLIAMLLGKNNYKAKNFSFASLAMSGLNFYSQEDSEAALLGIYKPVTFVQGLDSLLPGVLAAASLFPSLSAITDEFAPLFEKEAPVLNEYLNFDTDEKIGISLTAKAIEGINGVWPSVFDAIQNSTVLSDTLKAFLPLMLPDSFKDARFIVNRTNGVYTGLTFQVTGFKKAGSPAVATEYHPLTINFDAPKALAANYFDDLGTIFASADSDTTLISQVSSAESTLHTILTDYNSDLYDAIHHSKKFVKALKNYNANSYPLLSQVVNTPLIPDYHDDGTSIDFHYGPYESFDVIKQGDAQKNIVGDNYAPSAGDAFTLSAAVPVGTTATAFESAPAYSYALTGDTSINPEDYVSLSAGVLTIKKLPTASKLTLKITPETLEGYVPLTYTMVLNKVSA